MRLNPNHLKPMIGRCVRFTLFADHRTAKCRDCGKLYPYDPGHIAVVKFVMDEENKGIEIHTDKPNPKPPQPREPK